jgi:spore coat protein CotH
VRLFFNETGKQLSGDSQQPNDLLVGSYWPDNYPGELFKIDDWFEFSDDAQVSMQFNSDAQLIQYLTTGGAKKKARYRWSWFKSAVATLDDDYTHFYQMVDAMNLDIASTGYAKRVSAVVDVDEWMHVFALRHMINDWDSYGFSRGKNMSTYRPLDGTWKMLLWDMDHSHFSGGTTDANLFSINCP